MPRRAPRVRSRPLASLAAAALALSAAAAPAQARDGLELEAIYTADIAASASGGADGKVRYLDNLELSLDADLDKLMHWQGAALHVTVLNNMGARPNDTAGALEGFNNIEVSRAALRLFEAWAEQRIGNGSLRLGLYDLNSEFNATDSAALLISPPFGISSEFAASGPAGPSIFPSSALAARLRTEVAGGKGYAQVAVLNARAQTLGDPGGVDLGFADGLLIAGEIGGEIGAGETLRLSLGAWSYTRAFDALASTAPDGSPLRERPAGVYGMAEVRLAQHGPRAISAFLRGGLSRGRTQMFVNAQQAGLFVAPALIGRDDSALSIGVHRATSSPDFRAAQDAAGEPVWHSEQALEVTYLDAVLPHLTLQPDLQLIRLTGGPAPARTLVQATLRMQLSF